MLKIKLLFGAGMIYNKDIRKERRGERLIAAVAAVDRNFAIGNKGKMLIALPGDLKMFRELTSGHTVIMGRKTFDALPMGALPNRRNIVISSQAAGNSVSVCGEKGEYLLSSMEYVKEILKRL